MEFLVKAALFILVLSPVLLFFCWGCKKRGGCCSMWGKDKDGSGDSCCPCGPKKKCQGKSDESKDGS
ncbi:hypothetical protein [Candidatus Similichlamydia epinepheli]|uniref:hypothetical protein n=1 Tax=Candidatus Similichlamydia epinepheli TaxID=1903953 RepID=UPI000D387149|nr:hypothetical protein [Candidatus Similichlamydia epinepheli]